MLFHTKLPAVVFQLPLPSVIVGLSPLVRSHVKAKAVDAKDPFPRYNIGNVLSKLGRKDEAMAAWREALAIDSNHPGANSALGQELLDRKEYAAAVEHLQRSAAQTPDTQTREALTRAIRARDKNTKGSN